MAYSAKIFNVVLKIVKDGVTAGSVQGVDPLNVFAAALPQAGRQKPFITVRLPQEPFKSSQWGGTGNLRNGMFIVDVDLCDEMKVGDPNVGPFGDDPTTSPGLLTRIDQIQDLLENNRAAFLAASLKVVDFEMNTTAHMIPADAVTAAVATIRVAVKVRYTAGNS